MPDQATHACVQSIKPAEECNAHHGTVGGPRHVGATDTHGAQAGQAVLLLLPPRDLPSAHERPPVLQHTLHAKRPGQLLELLDPTLMRLQSNGHLKSVPRT